MSVLRSPNGGGIDKNRTLSEPDLSANNFDDYGSITHRNKRKHNDDDIEHLNNEISGLKDKMTEMMEILVSNSKIQTENMNKLCLDVKDIKHQVSSIGSTIKNIIAEQNTLKLKVESLIGHVECTKEKLMHLESDVEQLKQNSPGTASPNSPTHCEDIIKEIQERNIRSKNIIVVGIPESNLKTAQERHKYDKNEVTKIIKVIEPKSNEPTKTIRLGQYKTNQNRPIKVFFNSEEEAKEILRNKNNLKKDHIKIFSDQTPNQKKYLLNLKEELGKRTANGEANLIIKYVQGLPKIIRSTDINSSTAQAKSKN